MDKTRVREIVNPAANTGMGSNGKQWTQALVELENGVQTRIFMPINVGDEVESYTSPSKDGTKTFTNWRKPKRASIDLEPVLAKLYQLEELSLRLLKGTVLLNQKVDKLLNLDEPTPGADLKRPAVLPIVGDSLAKAPSWEAQREKFSSGLKTYPTSEEPLPPEPENEWLSDGERL